MLRQLHLLHLSLLSLSNCLFVEFFSCWYVTTHPPIKLMENILIEVVVVLIMTVNWGRFIKVHLTIVVLT